MALPEEPRPHQQPAKPEQPAGLLLASLAALDKQLREITDDQGDASADTIRSLNNSLAEVSSLLAAFDPPAAPMHLN